LARATGRNLGGQLVVDIESAEPQAAVDFDVEIIAASTDSREQLAVEMLDGVDGTWKGLAPLDGYMVSGDWSRLRFRGRYRAPNRTQAARVKSEVAHAAQPDAEILDVALVCSGSKCFVVPERQPFEIHVRVRFNRTPQTADVGIKLTRFDGVYAFWQSSGMVGENLCSPAGEQIARFVFSENLLGASEYFVSAHVTNGWRYPENYPYTHVFARVVNALSFRVAAEMPDVDFGMVNQRVNVIVECSH
jgi:lipopolysaccharide transport system ATP-binding protein